MNAAKTKIMKITVSDHAHKWFQEEVGVEKGQAVRFYGKVYGSTEVHDNFSVAIQVTEPSKDLLGEVTIDGITYYAEKADDWFFSGYDFEVNYDETSEDVKYHFISQ
ncbi:HesB/YadR/YfhF family protein [Oceanobacillus arenosus]|nr:iron-sulfur cluster biosynthesis protein [Oceanobacillus arenosus]